MGHTIIARTDSSNNSAAAGSNLSKTIVATVVLAVQDLFDRANH